ncbi:MAG: hypothetical protein GF335_01250 [Candidatus Moranbacteria bacterium]|nr:hypothetical protein [Candidatus Moranbacteria bacterium]
MKKVISTKKAAPAIGPYSQALKAGNFIFLSGQIGLTLKGEIVSENLEDQVHQIMKNIQAILKVENLDLKDIAKTIIFLTDMNDFVVVNEIYGKYFNGICPARSTVEVSKLPKGAKIEIEAIAVKDQF